MEPTGWDRFGPYHVGDLFSSFAVVFLGDLNGYGNEKVACL